MFKNNHMKGIQYSRLKKKENDSSQVDLKVIFDYTSNWRVAWAVQDPVSKTKGNK